MAKISRVLAPSNFYEKMNPPVGILRPKRGVRNRMSGRPPKFREPSRPVTVTLPNRTLDLLQRIDPDRAKAIVKATDGVADLRGQPPPEVDIVEVAPGVGLLVVPPSQMLKRISWLRMIEIAPTRFLLVIPSGTPVEKVELALIDLIEEARTSAPGEVGLLETLREKFAGLRRKDKVSKAEVLLVDV